MNHFSFPSSLEVQRSQRFTRKIQAILRQSQDRPAQFTAFFSRLTKPGWQATRLSGNNASRPLQGEESVTGPASGRRVYTIACANRYGQTSQSVTVSIKPPPTLSFYGRPVTIRPFQSFTLLRNKLYVNVSWGV